MVQIKVKPENIAAESNTDPRLKGNEETLFVSFEDINRGNYLSIRKNNQNNG